MKVRVTLEFEVADLPSEALAEDAEEAEIMGWDEELGVPTPIANDEMDDSDVFSAAIDFFNGLGDSYDSQRELWAGSGQFVWFKDIRLIDCKPA